MRFSRESLLILSVVVAVSLTILYTSCGESTPSIEASPTPELQTSQPPTTPTSESDLQNIDKPEYSNEEIATIILSKLSSILPNEYKIEQFNRATRKAEYLGDGKWGFSILGEGENRKSLPEEIVEQSEVLWIIYKKDQVTTFDLKLTAFYFEKSGLCEISSIDKYNDKTNDEIISERSVEAELRVTFCFGEHIGITNRFQVNVKNSSFVPINGIKLWASFSPYNFGLMNPVEIEEIVYKDVLYPDKTAAFTISFEDEDPTHIYYYPDFEFFTASGLKINHTFSQKALGITTDE